MSASPPALRIVHALTDADAQHVRILADRVREDDGVSGLSEQTLLQLTRTSPGLTHLLAGERGLAGYAQLDAAGDGPPSAELAVDPAARGGGIGRGLLDAVLEREPGARVWAHGLLPAARALAASAGLTVVRELWRLARPLGAGDEFDTALPEGYQVTTFEPHDAPHWLRLNAAAFTDHPEQGRLTSSDLADRLAQPWFDPQGFFLIRDPDGELAAFHWTKVEDGVGEVYVVGVAPHRQGLGLGRAATGIGLAYLRDRGLSQVVLYVDGDNAAALATYEKAGFQRDHLDAQLARG